MYFPCGKIVIIMKKLNNVFSEIKTPESWKENLYERIQEEEKMTTREVRRIKKVTSYIIAAAVVVSLSVVTAAATGILDFGGLLRKNYNDNISASKLEQGDYQPLDASVTSKNFEFTAKAFLGDEEESYVLLEAKVKNPELDVDKMSVTLYSLGEQVTDLEKYGTDTYESDAIVDENGNKSFLFRVKTYNAWVYTAVAEDTNLMLYINEIRCSNEEKERVIPANLKILFKPEFTDDGATEVSIGKKFEMDGTACTLDELIASDYGTKVSFSFTNEGGNGIMESWENARDTAEDMMGIDDYENFTLEESKVKLIVDGKEIPLIDNADSAPMEVTVSVYENDVTTTDADFTITFAPVDYDNAKSVAVRVKTDDGVKKFVLKK